LQTSQAIRRRMADRTAMPMFGLSLFFLTAVSVLVVIWVDVPRMVETSTGGTVQTAPSTGIDGAQGEPPVVLSVGSSTTLAIGYVCLAILDILWPIFLIEYCIQYLVRDRQVPFWRHRYFGLFICLCPPLRLCARNHDRDGDIWLPILGWQEVNDDLRMRLEKIFAVPMIIIALMILPVLLIEFRFQEQVAAHLWLRLLLHLSTGLIWLAFAAEFIVMASVAERKLRYCKEHWLDLAIILLPLISFLRSLRVVRATRLARVARVQQLSRMSRLYRLRALAVRGFRALLMLELLNRLLRISPEKQLRKYLEQLQEKEKEIASLRHIINDLEQEIAERKKVAADQETESLAD
jgi:hypothetical protein